MSVPLSSALADTVSVGGYSVVTLALGVIAAAAVMLVVFGLTSRANPADEVARRLERYAELGEGGDATRRRRGLTPRELFDQLTDALNQVMSRSSRTGQLADELAKADLKLKSSEWVLAVAGAGVLLGVLMALRFGSVIAFLPCPVAVWLSSGVVLRILQGRR